MDSIIDPLITLLNQSKGRWREIAAATGVPYSTLAKVAQRHSPNPRIGTVEALLGFFLDGKKHPANKGPRRRTTGR